MIVAPLNLKGCVGKMTRALQLGGARAGKDKRGTLIKAASQGSALDWSQQPGRADVLRLFGVVGLPRDTLHRKASGLARDADLIVIDGPPRAADLVLITVQPSPFNGWASDEMLALVAEARIYRPALVARFVLNLCGARTVIARETAETLADADLTVLTSPISQRVAFAAAAQSGRLVSELEEAHLAAREIAALATAIERLGIRRIAP
jgi:chromosome partitioning protein